MLRTVALGIGFGIAALVAVALSGSELSISLDRRHALITSATVTLYAVVGVLVTLALRDPNLRPRLREGPAGRALGAGAAVGAVTALALVALNSLLMGRPASDPSILAVFYDAAWFHVGALVFVIAIVAPVFEEVLFRGLLVEALRWRGRTSAILGAAVAFSIWHLNPAGLRYYVLIGFLLGYLYWRFGLAGSIATHAMFNSVLLVAAVWALSAGMHRIEVEGVHLDVPAGWTDVGGDAAHDVDLAVEAPNGASLVVQRSAKRVRVDRDARAIRPVTVAEIAGVRFTSAPDGVPTETIVLNRGRRTWVITFVAGGSVRASRDFERILPTIELYG